MSSGSDRPWRQPPTPGWGPPPQPPQNNRRGLKIAGAVVGALIVIGVISSATDGSGDSDNSADASSSPAVFDTPTDLPTTDDPLTDDPALSDEDPTDDSLDDPTTPDAPETVTYIVSGSNSEVTYGPAGSSLSGHAPMKITRKLGNPAYYAISAQLNGSGHVSCKLEIDGEVVSQARASGSYQIATCEAVNLGGEWEDANSG